MKILGFEKTLSALVRIARLFAMFFAASIFASSASATETSTYKYDALGRLVETTTSGGPSNGTSTAVAYDKAGNRSNYNVTGAPNTIPVTGARVIVVPLNGFTVIPIN